MTRMGHNEMLAEVEQSGCQHLTRALIAKRPTCVAKRHNGKSPTGQHRNQESWGGAEGVRPNLLLHFGVGLHARSMPPDQAASATSGEATTRLSIASTCPSSRVQRPEWGAARGTMTPKSGVMVDPGRIERATRSICCDPNGALTAERRRRRAG